MCNLGVAHDTRLHRISLLIIVKRLQTKTVRILPMKGLNTTIWILLLLPVSAASTPLTLACNGAAIVEPLYVAVSEETVIIQGPDSERQIPRLPSLDGLILPSEMAPGLDDERLITKRMFRFDSVSGDAFLLDSDKLVFRGSCECIFRRT